MKKILSMLLLLCLLSACTKDDAKSYIYWSDLTQEQYREINALILSVPCTDISDFEIVYRNGYHLLHPSISVQFETLQSKLDYQLAEMNKAAAREGIYNATEPLPNPPIKKICANGLPKLIFAQELSLEEVMAEILTRYTEISTFYKDVSCTDANAWFTYRIRTNCCDEAIAIHKTIGTEEIINKIETYNRLIERKKSLVPVPCPAFCPVSLNTVQCVDGKATVK